jgi:hypothetical protein
MKILIIDYSQYNIYQPEKNSNFVFVEPDTSIFLNTEGMEIIKEGEILSYNSYTALDNISDSFLREHFAEFHYNQMRYMQDLQLINDYYIKSVCYWYDYLKNNKVEFIMSLHPFNSSPCYMVMKVANYFGIDSFEGIPIVNINNKRTDLTFISLKDKEFVKRTKIISYQPSTIKVKKTNLATKIKSSLSRILFANLLVHDFYLILRKRNSNKIETYNFKFLKDVNDFFNYFVFKFTLLFESKKIIDLKEEKFIFFALHLEPEASITGKRRLISQLSWIEIISRHLPKDILLVVKEHPDSLRLDSLKMHYLIRNIGYFKSRKFYKKLMSNDKIILIHPNQSADLLISKSIMTISLRGSVLGEAILKKKNSLLLEPHHSILKYVKNVIKFSSINNLIEILETLDPISSEISYKDSLEVFNTYCYETTPPIPIQLIVNDIRNHLKGYKC